MGRGIDFKCQCGHEYKDYYGTGFIGEDFLPDEKLDQFLRSVQEGTAVCPACGKTIDFTNIGFFMWD